MNTTLLDAFQGAVKKLHIKGVKSVLTDLEIVKMTIRSVKTCIVPGDVPEGTEFMTEEERREYLADLKLLNDLWDTEREQRGESRCHQIAQATRKARWAAKGSPLPPQLAHQR